MDYQLPRAILFDLDDTILSFGLASDQCWRDAVRRFAPQIDGYSAEELLAAINEYRAWFWSDPVRHRRGRLELDGATREIVGAVFGRLGIDMPSLVNDIADSCRAARERWVKPFPGAIETLGRIREMGTRLALITNGASGMQRKKIDAHGLEPFFDCIVIEGEFGAGKPDESVYIHALQQLDAQPADAWMVGDNLEWEVAAPQRLGILSIWVDHASKGLPEHAGVRPDRIIGAISELL